MTTHVGECESEVRVTEWSCPVMMESERACPHALRSALGRAGASPRDAGQPTDPWLFPANSLPMNLSVMSVMSGIARAHHDAGENDRAVYVTTSHWNITASHTETNGTGVLGTYAGMCTCGVP